MPKSNEWVAVMGCSSCRKPIRSVVLAPDDDGRFELRGLPGKCESPDCQASFDASTDHSLQVTFYRKQLPTELVLQ